MRKAHADEATPRLSPTSTQELVQHMKIRVIRRVAPAAKQHRYRVLCTPSPWLHQKRFAASGDILPDVMASLPKWAFPIFDTAFTHLRDSRPWSFRDSTLTITIEIK